MSHNTLAFIMAGAILVSLTIYSLLAGADYGGGMWDLFATGPRKAAQRDLIAHAIGPIWEANHVWLILVVVIMFTSFPTAWSLLMVWLHIPMSIMLVGVVLRGSAFAFRSHITKEEHRTTRWGRVFAIASLATPLLLGMIVGAITSGQIRNSGPVDFIHSWWGPLPWAVGGFAVSLFAYLAAVYLTLETSDAALQNDFRMRGLVTAVVSAVMALVVYEVARSGAPLIFSGLTVKPWARDMVYLTAFLGMASMLMLWLRRYSLARITAAGQIVCILWGWGIAQFPYLVVPDLTLFNAAAPAVTLRMQLTTLAIGLVLLLPSFVYLFVVFKAEKPTKSPL